MKYLLLILAIALSQGCATITRGTSESFVVETNPPGAEVSSSSGWTCKTPCSVKVKRRGDFVLTIEKEGYETVTATITSSIDGAGAAGMAGNALIGGLIGVGVDAGSGAMHSHKPNPLEVSMVRLDAAVNTRSEDSETVTKTPEISEANLQDQDLVETIKADDCSDPAGCESDENTEGRAAGGG